MKKPSDTADDEMNETDSDESVESSDTQKQEEDTGTEGVKLPEDFQKQAHSFVSGLDTDAKIRYVQDCCNEQMGKLQSTEAGTDEYSDSDMPK